MESSKICKKCNTLCVIGNFYKSKNKSYLDGRIDWCKKCIKEYKKRPDTKAVYRFELKEVIFSFD